MKTKLIRLFVALALLALPALVQAQFTYTTNNGAITIIGYNTAAGLDVVIPAATNGYPVTAIGTNAFYNQRSITNVTIPNSVTSIGDYAFAFCIGLTNLTIGDSVTSIGNYAFASCIGLTNLSIGDSVTSIGVSVFYNCTHLISVTLPNSVTSIGGSAFTGCSGLTSVTIPNSVTNIGGSAFSGCSGLTNIIVNAVNSSYASAGGVLFNQTLTLLIQYPGGLVGSYAIPNSVTSIGDGAFQDTGLTGLTIPNSVTSIGDTAFEGCTGLTSVTIPNSVTSIGFGAFEGTRLTSVTIPNSVTNIGDYAFELCASLYSATIGNSVTNIGDYAFEFCSSLLSATIGNSVTSIGNYAFAGCESLPSVTLPNSVTNIGDGAFASCNSLTGVTIPNSVTSIGNGAFAGCIGLTGVTIPASVNSIGSAPFEDCYRLTAIIVAANNPAYSSLNGVLFDKSQTTLLQYPGGLFGSYTIPGSVTNIGVEAFYFCSSLTSVTIPNSVTAIGAYAFAYTFGYNYQHSVIFTGNAPSSANDSTVFAGDYNTTVYYLAGTTGWGSTFDGVPAVLLNPQATAMSVTGGQFGFTLTGPSYAVIVVEATTNLAHPVWLPVSTNTLSASLSGSGTSAFSDPQSTGYPMRYYRFRMP